LEIGIDQESVTYLGFFQSGAGFDDAIWGVVNWHKMAYKVKQD
jgi:hypothetical protein